MVACNSIGYLIASAMGPSSLFRFYLPAVPSPPPLQHYQDTDLLAPFLAFLPVTKGLLKFSVSY
jgi:hypothetical protein